MSTPRSRTFSGFVIGATLAAIAFGVLIAMLIAGIGHPPHDVGDILVTLFEGLFVCLLGGAIGALARSPVNATVDSVRPITINERGAKSQPTPEVDLAAYRASPAWRGRADR